MTHPSDAASKSVDERIAELNAELEAILAVISAKAAEEKAWRAKEDPARRLSFAREIFGLQQDRLRLDVEAEFVRKKIKRLQLGYAENDAGAPGPSDGFVF